MAYPDRQIGGGTPDRFVSLVGELFDAQESQSLSSRFNEIRGPMAKEIAQWRSEGLGRVIAVPVPYISRDRVEGGQYRTMAYALPFTDESVKGHDKRVVLVFAAEGGPHLVTLVGPEQSDHEEAELRAIENENFLSSFDLFFTPSEKPMIIDGWMPKPREKPFKSFNSNISLFPITDHTPEDMDSEAIYKQAVANARRMKIRRLRIDEESLRGQLDIDPNLSALFDVATADWDQLKGGKNIIARKILFKKGLGNRENPGYSEAA